MRTFCEIRWYHGTWLPSYKKGRGQVFLMLRLSNSEAVRACTIKLLNLKVAKHEKVAIYGVNQRISNVLHDCRSSKLRGAIRTSEFNKHKGEVYHDNL